MPADFKSALQPITDDSGQLVPSQSTRILKELVSLLQLAVTPGWSIYVVSQAPQLLHPRILKNPAFLAAATSSSPSASTSSALSLSNTNNAFLQLARTVRLAPLIGGSARSARKGKGSSHQITSTDLRIVEGVQRLLDLPIPALPPLAEEDEDGDGSVVNEKQVGLWEGYKATEPSAASRKAARRQRRAGISERQLGIANGASELGLKELGARARGLLSDYTIESVESTPRRRTIRGKRRSSFLPPGLNSNVPAQELEEDVEQMTRPELEAEIKEITLDKDALHVRRKLVLKDLGELEERIRKLEEIKAELGDGLLRLKEEELELDDELEGVRDRLAALEAKSSGRVVSNTSSRRRRGPAFLPSEHDDLPVNVAFMTLPCFKPALRATSLPTVTALDFSEPYGTLVSASADPDSEVRVWDLSNGEEVGRLTGHRGTVKALLVEGDLCVTGGADGKIALWDLPTVIETGFFDPSTATARRHPAIREEDEDVFTTSIRRGSNSEDDTENTVSDGFSSARLKLLEGHSKDVTCISYENTSLVSGSSDKTLRLWDLTTGQCVVTMDILWAISNPAPSASDEESDVQLAQAPDSSLSGTSTMSSPAAYDTDYPWHASDSYMTPNRKRSSLSGLRRLSSHYGGLSTMAGSPYSPTTPQAQLSSFNFAQPTPPFSDGSWEMYSDFVGGLQLWSYALASGSADGCVRMWDTRTGLSVRSLIGHTGAITCLQFDNYHLVSGSLDKSVRTWDLRTGRTIDTLQYDGPVTALQFDTRRILVAGGSNAVQVFNRTTLQKTELVMNGHTSPVERLRFMDKYLATGARDATVKIWSLA